MASLSELETMPLSSLYRLLAEKLEEMRILWIKNKSDPEFKSRKLEIEMIQKVIDQKKLSQ